MSLRPSTEKGLEAPTPSSSRPWSNRRNRLGVRKGEMAVIVVVALIVGIVLTLATAYMGVR